MLDAVNGKYQTNMGIKKITSLIKKQLDDMSPWTITSYSLTGKDSSNYTYTYNQLLYVMEPDLESIEEAKTYINKVLGNENLDSSYGEKTGNSNTVTKVPTNPTPSPEPEPPKEETKDNVIDNNDGNNTLNEDLSSDTTDEANDDILIPSPENDESNNVDSSNEDNEEDNKEENSDNNLNNDDVQYGNEQEQLLIFFDIW